MEYRDRQWMITRRRMRAYSLLGALCLLMGLILKVQAQAPPVVENPKLHTFRPALVGESNPIKNLHQPVKPAQMALLPEVTNPTGQSDLVGRSCRQCHTSSNFISYQPGCPSTYAVAIQGGQPGFGADDACESGHPDQLILENRTTLLR